MKYYYFRGIVVFFLVIRPFLFAGSNKGFAQPIPKSDVDLEQIRHAIPALFKEARTCYTSGCPGIDCKEAQDFYIRMRDARFYLRSLYHWLIRANHALSHKLISETDNNLISADKISRVNKINGWLDSTYSLYTALRRLTVAGIDFLAIAKDASTLNEATYEEMSKMYNQVYYGDRSLDKIILWFLDQKNDPDFPVILKDHLGEMVKMQVEQERRIRTDNDFFPLLFNLNIKEPPFNWRQKMKQGRSLLEMEEMISRYSVATSSFFEKRHGIKNAFNKIIGQAFEHNIQHLEIYRWLERIKDRLELAEEVYYSLEDLIIIEGNQSGILARCLLKHNRKCTSLDLNYASKIEVPESMKLTIIISSDPPIDQNIWENALIYFNEKMPAVTELLKKKPGWSGTQVSTIKTEKNIFRAGEFIKGQFSVSSCTSPDPWAGILPASFPRGDELGVSLSLINGRIKLGNQRTGVFQAKAPNEPGKYHIRMFDPGSGKEIAHLEFVVQAPALAFDGIFYEMPMNNNRLTKFETSPDGKTVSFGGWNEGEEKNWKPVFTGTIKGNIVEFQAEVGCGYGPQGRTAGESRVIPFRLVMSGNGNIIELQHHRFTCDSRGKMKVYPEWDEQLSKTSQYMRK